MAQGQSGEEFVGVEKDIMGSVIGKGGCNIIKIQKESGAKYIKTIRDKGFVVGGSQEQIECARRKILEAVPEMIDIPDDFKGLVIGSNQKTLNEIRTRTEAHLFLERKNVYMTGTPEAKEKAHYEVQFIVGQRVPDQNKLKRSFCFVDDFKLSRDCILHLVQDQRLSQLSKCRYRLRNGSNDSSPSANNGNPCYIQELTDYVKRSLDEIKKDITSGEQTNIGMRFHFGTVGVKDVGKQWTLEKAAQNLASPFKEKEGDADESWGTTFVDGVTFDTLGDHVNEPVDDTRYNIGILTPSRRAVSCEVWVRHEELKENTEHDEKPFNHFLGEVRFKNKQTEARCKGWLCLPTDTKKLKAKILFPACEFDCRLTLQTSRLFASEKSATAEEENEILLEYLSDLTLMEGEKLQFPDRTLPEDFHVIYNRCSRRTSYFDDEDFTIIVSRDTTNPPGTKVTNLFLHCNKWDELMQTAEWEPQEIVEKFPSFLKFVSKVQQLIINKQEAQARSGPDGI